MSYYDCSRNNGSSYSENDFSSVISGLLDSKSDSRSDKKPNNTHHVDLSMIYIGTTPDEQQHGGLNEMLKIFGY